MRLTAMILLGTALHVAAKTTGQTVNFSGHDVPLNKVFQAIEQQTGYVVFYDQSVMEDARPVSITVNDFPLTDFLNEVLEGQSLGYSIKKKTIVIKRVTPRLATNGAHAASGNGPVKGRVVNEKGEPVEGVSVTVKGSNIGTSTNANGEFFLDNIDDNATLVFTHTSIEKTEQKRDGRVELTVGVKVRSSILDEVQVIPYGTQTKRFSVGNVTTVKGEDIAKQPVNNPLLALAGRVPGLVVKQQSGITGAEITVRVQGQNSIKQGNEPLYIIDGIPYPANVMLPDMPLILGSSGGSPLSWINPSDIASIEILKDADATAIYGSRAGNGAIIITTKKAAIGRTNVEINLQRGWSEVPKKVDLLTTRQYLDMRYEAYKNDGIDWRDPSVSAVDLKIWDTTRYTDWQKELIGRRAEFDNVNLSVAGGNATSQYLLGGTWHRETSVFPINADDQKMSMHFDINNSSKDKKFDVQLSGSYLLDKNRLPVSDLTAEAILTVPNAPSLYLADGSVNWEPDASGHSTFFNPVATYSESFKLSTNNLVSSLQVGYKILPGLELRNSAGYNAIQQISLLKRPSESIIPEERALTPRFATYGSLNTYSWIVEPQVSYKKAIRKFNVKVLMGSTIQKNETHSNTISGEGHSSDLLLDNIQSAATLTGASSTAVIYRYNALFGRLISQWNRKYIFSTTLRRDGSSRFGIENRFHNFWSIGGAWVFADESFIRKKLSFLSFGKVRLSLGTTGHDQIGDYNERAYYYSTFSEVPYQNMSGLVQGGLVNPYVQWEEIRKWQMGLDLGIVQDRIILNATYSQNRSSNQLINLKLPSITGFAGVTQNFPATVSNTTYEFSLQSTNFKQRNIEWSSSFNITIPNNKLIAFPNLNSSNSANELIIGQPLGLIRTVHFYGVDTQTGLYQVSDGHGNPVSNFPPIEDRNVLVTTSPKLYGGLQNNLSFKSFEIEFFFQFIDQSGPNHLYYYHSINSSFFPGQFGNNEGNQPVSVLDRWQSPGDIRPIQRFSTKRLNGRLAMASDAGYIKTSFIRLKNVAASWSVPPNWLKRMHLKNARVYIQGQNIVTFTKYRGLDPENQNVGVLPPLRTLVIGIDVDL